MMVESTDSTVQIAGSSGVRSWLRRIFVGARSAFGSDHREVADPRAAADGSTRMRSSGALTSLRVSVGE